MEKRLTKKQLAVIIVQERAGVFVSESSLRKNVTLVVALTLSIVVNVQSATADRFPLIHLNGEPASSEIRPLIVDGRVLVPLRVISEELGYVVDWDSDTRTVYVNNTRLTIPSAPVGSSTDIRLIVNGRLIAADVAPRIIHSRVMVPIRIIAESMNAAVRWEAGTKQVTMVQPDKLRQDTFRAIDDFLYWIDASYDYPEHGTPDDFGAWMTKKMNIVRESHQLVSTFASFLAGATAEGTSPPLYALILEAAALMEHEKENVTYRLVHLDAYDRLKEIAAELQ